MFKEKLAQLEGLLKQDELCIKTTKESITANQNRIKALEKAEKNLKDVQIIDFDFTTKVDSLKGIIEADNKHIEKLKDSIKETQKNIKKVEKLKKEYEELTVTPAPADKEDKPSEEKAQEN